MSATASAVALVLGQLALAGIKAYQEQRDAAAATRTADDAAKLAAIDAQLAAAASAAAAADARLDADLSIPPAAPPPRE